MSDSEGLGFEECLALLREFHEAIPIDESNTDLSSKKKNAEKALKHLGEMHSNDTKNDDDEGEDNEDDDDEKIPCPKDVPQLESK